jgi:23S rRNA (uracil1939-C5)-methyltransferase
MGLKSRRPAGQLTVGVVTDLSHDGRGVAHHEGKTIFVDDALPGERVVWSVYKRSRNFDEAALKEVLEPSADRAVPACPHFGVCGGCVLQHLQPEQQLAFKQTQLLESLARIGKVTPANVLPPLQADVWNYRRKARLAARWVPKKARTVVGFRERSTPFIADLKGCPVLQPPADRLVEPLSMLASALSVRDRLPQIEVAVADDVTALVIRILQPLTQGDHELLHAFAREHDVEIYLQPGGYETVAPLAGSTPLVYRLPAYDLALEFLPTDFVQVNAALNRRMVDRAIELLETSPTERVLDLFCGLGNFSLPLARRAGQVVGVEGEAGLVARARANSVRNGLANTEFHVANLASEELPAAAWAQSRYDKILLDPPRAGAREILPVVARSGAGRVLYISCHPGSLARDAGILVQEHGYTLASAGVMDMFPHTAHVESAALFVKE